MPRRHGNALGPRRRRGPAPTPSATSSCPPQPGAPVLRFDRHPPVCIFISLLLPRIEAPICLQVSIWFGQCPAADFPYPDLSVWDTRNHSQPHECIALHTLSMRFNCFLLRSVECASIGSAIGRMRGWVPLAPGLPGPTPSQTQLKDSPGTTTKPANRGIEKEGKIMQKWKI